MPSGKTHDRLTIATAALSAPLWYLASPSQDFAAYAAGVAGYLFSGFYLSCDLDTRSSALKRWGPLAAIWRPYRQLAPHRSWISHGLAIGPILRAAYFAGAVWLIARGILWLIDFWLIHIPGRNALLTHALLWALSALWRHKAETEWALAGLILGGVTHTLADLVVSAVKKLW